MTRRAIAPVFIAIALILVVALGLYLNGTFNKTSKSSLSYGLGVPLYNVTFIQQAATCPPSIPEYVVPWSVTLGNQTKVQPPNATVNGNSGWSPSNIAYSKIVFLVPNGDYNYTTIPNRGSYTPFDVYSGTVYVDNSNVTVKVGPAEVYCAAVPTTTTTQPSSVTQTQTCTPAAPLRITTPPKC